MARRLERERRCACPGTAPRCSPPARLERRRRSSSHSGCLASADAARAGLAGPRLVPATEELRAAAVRRAGTLARSEWRPFLPALLERSAGVRRSPLHQDRTCTTTVAQPARRAMARSPFRQPVNGALVPPSSRLSTERWGVWVAVHR